MDPTTQQSPRHSPRAEALDNPAHVRPWRNRIAAASLLVVAILTIAIAAFAL